MFLSTHCANPHSNLRLVLTSCTRIDVPDESVTVVFDVNTGFNSSSYLTLGSTSTLNFFMVSSMAAAVVVAAAWALENVHFIYSCNILAMCLFSEKPGPGVGFLRQW